MTPGPRRLANVVASLAIALISAACHDAAPAAAPSVSAASPAGSTLAPVAPASSSGDGRRETPPSEPAVRRIEGGFQELAVPGFRPAYAFVPPGAEDARFPFIVASHGAGGMAEPHCEHWSRMLRQRAYVLCPRGTAIGVALEGKDPTGYFYRDHRALGREVMALREAAIAAFGPRIDPERAIYTGYSQGGQMGALFLHELANTPERGAFAYLILVDGGWMEWTRDIAQKEHASGMRGVAVVCGQARCAREAKQRVGWMEASGLPVRLEYAQGAGHTWGGAVAEKVEGVLDWLLADDPRFARVDSR